MVSEAFHFKEPFFEIRFSFCCVWCIILSLCWIYLLYINLIFISFYFICMRTQIENGKTNLTFVYLHCSFGLFLSPNYRQQ